ncbi:hypothetical protein CTA1_3134 [Colletotrichum tanaceti]|uniref:HNH nuclease domain-containing protein n=1 Tax=Colletotrichum tanaceti TaxID=1306861 RepID=A0A4U6XVS3_9PEZI|nr:hypothetical protein CTA1_3134 [Colletotrichum tanaceti]
MCPNTEIPNFGWLDPSSQCTRHCPRGSVHLRQDPLPCVSHATYCRYFRHLLPFSSLFFLFFEFRLQSFNFHFHPRQTTRTKIEHPTHLPSSMSGVPPPLSNRQVEDLKAKLHSFLERTHPEFKPTFRDTQNLTRYFLSNVRRNMGSHGDNEYLGDEGEVDLTERFALVDQIRKKILSDPDVAQNDDQLKDMARKEVWAHLMVLDLPRLREFASALPIPNVMDHLSLLFKGMNNLVWYLRGPIQEWEKVKTGVTSRSNAARVGTAERDLCVCPFTRSINPEKCHIVPFWTLNRPRCYEALIAATVVFGKERSRMLRAKLVDRETNIVDTSANTISLNRALHKFWDHGLFGLEPVCLLYEKDKTAAAIAKGEAKEESAAPDPSTSSKLDEKRSREAMEDTPSKRAKGKGKEKEQLEDFELKEAVEPKRRSVGIRIRFHWLRKTIAVTPDTIPRNMAELRTRWSSWDPNVTVHDVDGRPLDDGHIVDVYDTDDAKAPDFDILQLQFDIFRMQALSGRADPMIYAPDYYYDEDGQTILAPPPGKMEALEAHEAREAHEVLEFRSESPVGSGQVNSSGQGAENTTKTAKKSSFRSKLGTWGKKLKKALESRSSPKSALLVFTSMEKVAQVRKCLWPYVLEKDIPEQMTLD